MNENIYRRKNKTSLPFVIIMLLVLLILIGVFWFFQQKNMWTGEKNIDEQKITELEDTIKKQKNDLLKQKNDIAVLNEKLDKMQQASNNDYILVRSNEIVTAIKNKNMGKLATYVDPDKGLRLSPYAYVDTEKHIQFTQEQIKNLNENTSVYTWGSYDGSGEPIKLTFEKYYNDFVYDKDYINAVTVANNYRAGNGNSLSNISQAYPGARFVEYHFPGVDSRYAGMDWKSIRLIFQMKSNIWYLVGIVHDQWTI
jgi:hypothetical protein